MLNEVLVRLPEKVTDSLNVLKSRYNDERFNTDVSRAEIRGYLKGLRDSGIITKDLEYRILFCYCTV